MTLREEPGDDLAKNLVELATVVAGSKEEMLKQLAGVEQKGSSRLNGLIIAAERLLQELGLGAGRMQNLGHEASSRRNLLAEKARQHASLAEELDRATDSTRRNRIASDLRANENRSKLLAAEEAQSRRSIGEVTQQLAGERRTNYLRIIKALKAAIDEADATADAQASTKDSAAREGVSSTGLPAATGSPMRSDRRNASNKN